MEATKNQNSSAMDNPLVRETLELFMEWDSTGIMPEKLRDEIEKYKFNI